MKSSLCLAAGLLLYSAAFADTYIDDISVSKAGDSIQVDVTADKPCMVEHFLIDEPPQKIVVDLHGVINNWSPKSFANLPLVSLDRISLFMALQHRLAMICEISSVTNYKQFTISHNFHCF